MASVIVETSHIVDAPTFHAAFAAAMGFPAFYGRNMDAWIDFMSSLTEEGPPSSVHLGDSEALLLTLPKFEALLERVPEVVRNLLECTAIVNGRYAENGEAARIALVFE